MACAERIDFRAIVCAEVGQRRSVSVVGAILELGLVVIRSGKRRSGVAKARTVKKT